ncbi:MAG: shikimate dehydrogenase [Candidatus Dormibacteria bacterium]|jgi:shikimate dehydrogenase
MPGAVTLQLGLIGSGIAGSPSPAMHRAALQARGLAGDYELFDVAPAELPALLLRLRAGELAGCNVTTPYKTALAAACDRLEGDAARCQAVNTLTLVDGELVGENTDANGLQLALSYRRLWPAPGCRAVVLGAGGAAAAAVLALTHAPADDIAVVARRVEAAESLCQQVAPEHARVLAFDDRAAVNAACAEASIVVNATPVGIADLPLAVDALPATCAVADLRYRPRPVDLVAAAQARGLGACDGEEMLLFQGMLSFRRWTGAEPPWHAARDALHEALGG